MKKTLFTFIFMGGTAISSFAQKAPEKVTKAFQSKFPSATNVKWEKENDKEWEAEFKMDGKEYSANFSADGKWIETEHEIKVSDLPKAVKDVVAKEFQGYEIEEAEKIEGSEIEGYELELEKGESTLEVLISKDGKVLKKEVEEEDEEDDH